MNIVHKDLKPDNILLNSKNRSVLDIRLADFGFASVIGDMASKREEKIICGTPGYIAPETLKGHGYSLKSDIFSAGCIFYSLLTGDNLFYVEDYNDTLALNRECNLRPAFLLPSIVALSDDCKNLLRGLLAADPSKRLSAT
jgi:serine/threonine protein kinase